MVKGLLKNKPFITIVIILIALLIICSIFIFAIPELDTHAHAASLETNLSYQIPYYVQQGISLVIAWDKADFNPYSSVYWKIGEGNGHDIHVYSWTMVNADDSNIAYAGNYNNGSVTWQNGLYPKIAGEYQLTCTATHEGQTLSKTETITLRGYAKVEENINNPFQVFYDGYNYIDLNNPQINGNPGYSPQSVDVNTSFYISESGGLKSNVDYTLVHVWNQGTAEVKNASSYRCELYLTDNNGIVSYIDYGYLLNENWDTRTNLREFVIKKRPLLLAKGQTDASGNYESGVVFVEKEKMYDGTSEAHGFIPMFGTDSSRYDYLLDATIIGNHSGFLRNDLYGMINNFSSSPFLFFYNVNQDLNSHYFVMDGSEEVPSASVSALNEFGEIIYDKYIRVYFEINPYYYATMRNYDVTLDGETYGSDYFTFVEQGAIIPGLINVFVDPTDREYGLHIPSIVYELLTQAAQPAPGNIGVHWDGALLGTLFNLVHHPDEVVDEVIFDGIGYIDIPDIDIMIKTGRRYVPGFDSLNDVAFRGENSVGETVFLIENYNPLPSVGELFFYPVVYYNGEQVQQNDAAFTFQCGNLILRFIVHSLIITQKQLYVPPQVIIESEKVYDGLKQANVLNFDENTFDGQWVADDGNFLEMLIRPVFDNALAGENKQLIIEYILRLNEQGIAQNKHNLISRYKIPSEEIRENGVIHKRQVGYAFDMSGAYDKPNEFPYTNFLLFPEDKILIYEKAYGAAVPLITDLIFGDFDLDAFGNIQYEQVYTYKVKTYVIDGRTYIEEDFYGNYLYEIDYSVPPVLKPKMKNSFVHIDDPFSSNLAQHLAGFEFESAIDWSFYGIPIYEGSTLKRIEVSRYNHITNEVIIVDQHTPGVQSMMVGEDTLSVGFPGIGIRLMQRFDSANYEFVAKPINSRAFITITKRDPNWEMNATQTYTYSGKQHSSMLDNINLTIPNQSDYGTYAEYLIALNDYNQKVNTFDRIIRVNLNNHDDFNEIVGSGGMGINFVIKEYGFPGQNYTLPIESPEYANILNEILLIKHAGKYLIEVSLPETTLYKASSVRELNLTIEPKRLNVYLSEAEIFYLDPLPDFGNIQHKEDILDSTSWGWRIYNYDVNSFRSTILYAGFVEYRTLLPGGEYSILREDPDNIGFGSFTHPQIRYLNVEGDYPPPTSYDIMAYGGASHNYYFSYVNFPKLTVKKFRAEIILTKNEVTKRFDNSSWRVYDVNDPDNNDPELAAYIYTANDTSQVNVTVVGYVPKETSYDFSIHYSYRKDEFGNIVYDMYNNPIIIDFHPKVIFYNGEWVPYETGMTGEIRDITPVEGFQFAINVGQYILCLSASPFYYLEPNNRFIKFNVDYAETVVQVTEDIIVHEYNNTFYRINGIPSDPTDDNFTINNKEVNVFIKLEKSLTPFDNPTYFLVYDFRLYDDDMDTQINEAGYYRVTLILEYAPGALRNYNIPEINEFVLRIEVTKSQVNIQFGISEGAENWLYRGTPYEVLNMDNFEHGTLGVTYIVTPNVPFSDILFEIHRVVYNGFGEIIEFIPVDAAIEVGSYRFRLKATGENTENYYDSDWIEQIFTIQRAVITVRIVGKPILPEDQHLFPGLTTYPLSKTYGDAIDEGRYEIVYEGWVNGEDPYDESKFPSGFQFAITDWRGVDDIYMNARPNTPYTISAIDAQADNYQFVYRNIPFVIYRKQGQILVNEEYSHSTYTGTDQRYLETFRARRAPDDIYEETMPYAFALNHDPTQVTFNITLIARLVLNPDTGLYERNTNVTECVDVGRYIFRISADSSTNYTAVPPTEFEFVVVKAELRAIIEDTHIIYGDHYPLFTLRYEGYVGKDNEDIEFNPSRNPLYTLNTNGECILISGASKVSNLVHPILNIPQNAINAGNYQIGLLGGSSDNYYINLDNKANLEIRPKNITVQGSALKIQKEYDGTMEADSYVDSRHFNFVGIIHHHLKPYEDVIVLTFSASFDSHEVGRRTVQMQELSIDNLNYRLLTVQFECSAEITKRTPNIILFSDSFTYDGTAKSLSPVIQGLVEDQVNYEIKYKGVGSTTYVESSKPPITAGTYEVTVTTNDNNYVSVNKKATMTIHKTRVTIMFGGDKMQTYGSVTGLSARAIGLAGYIQNIEVKYYDAEGKEKDNIATASFGVYRVKAIYTSTANYLSEQREEELWINPKTVSVNFLSSDTYLYDGLMKHQRVTFYNVSGDIQETLIKYSQIVDGQEIFINVDSEGNVIGGIAPKGAGIYNAYAIAPNDNYQLTGQLSSSFEIMPKNINIKVNDLTINEGTSPTYTYTIEGIASGENVNSLKVKPLMSFYDKELGRFVEGNPNKVGVYRILPYGASDNNYIITYTEGRLTINAVQLVANTTYHEGLKLEGSFSPDANLSVRVVQSGSYSRANTSFEVFKMNNENFKTSVLSDIYDISMQQGSVEGDMITIRLLLHSVLRGAESYSIAHIKLDGSVEIIEVIPTSDDYLVFNVNELGHFSVIVEESRGVESLWIYVAIAGAILIILIGLIIIKKKA